MAEIGNRIEALNWDSLGEGLDRDGYALTPALLQPEECAQLVQAYDDDSLFRSQVVMARFGFGRGEYKYFKYKLPAIVAELREHCYLRLATLESTWAGASECGV